jgi:hypothetical protein
MEKQLKKAYKKVANRECACKYCVNSGTETKRCIKKETSRAERRLGKQLSKEVVDVGENPIP